MNRQLRGLRMKVIIGGACAATLLFAACTREPCPRGQEAREERYPGGTQLKSKGCVGKDSDDNYRAQGRWEFFYRTARRKPRGNTETIA